MIVAGFIPPPPCHVLLLIWNVHTERRGTWMVRTAPMAFQREWHMHVVCKCTAV